jgi:allantoinase
VHVSSAPAIQRIRLAFERELDVTCETCPHYLVLNEDFLRTHGAIAKCAPPLRSTAERDVLCRELRAGHIDFVASDHSPSPPSMKTSDDAFAVWGGIAGVQHTRSVLPDMPAPQMARLTATAVADRFRIPNKGRVEVGYDADLALAQSNAMISIKRDELLDRHKASPYVHLFWGAGHRVRRTIVRGHTVRYGGSLVGDFRGRLVKPERRRKAGAA